MSLNTHLMNQAVITCTSLTRPTRPADGLRIYEVDTHTYWRFDGISWQRTDR